jgi:hypothetical protein
MREGGGSSWTLDARGFSSLADWTRTSLTPVDGVELPLPSVGAGSTPWLPHFHQAREIVARIL